MNPCTFSVYMDKTGTISTIRDRTLSCSGHVGTFIVALDIASPPARAPDHFASRTGVILTLQPSIIIMVMPTFVSIGPEPTGSRDSKFCMIRKST